MATIAVDLGDLEADDAPIEVTIPEPTPEATTTTTPVEPVAAAPTPAPAHEEPVKPAPAPAATEPLSVSVDDSNTATTGGQADEFKTPTQQVSPSKKLTFADSVTPSASERAAVSATYEPPHFSPTVRTTSVTGTPISPKSPNPQAFVPPNLDETLRESYMEHVSHYTNRILPFTQSAKSLVSRQSTLLDRLKSMRGEMERAERELDLAVDEFSVLKKSTRGNALRFEMPMYDDAGGIDGADESGLLMASSDYISSPYRSSNFSSSRGRSVALEARERWSAYKARSPSVGRRHYQHNTTYNDDAEMDTGNSKYHRSIRFRDASPSYLHNSYLRPSSTTRYTSHTYDNDDHYYGGDQLCEHELGLESAEPPMSYSFQSSLGRYSSHFSGRASSVLDGDQDLLRSTRRFEETLRNLRSTYTSLGQTTSDDKITTLHVV